MENRLSFWKRDTYPYRPKTAVELAASLLGNDGALNPIAVEQLNEQIAYRTEQVQRDRQYLEQVQRDIASGEASIRVMRAAFTIAARG